MMFQFGADSIQKWPLIIFSNALGTSWVCLHDKFIIHMHSKRNDNKNEVTYVSAVDFERYLEQLPLQQAQQLRNFMQNNPLVESSNKGSQKFYRGSPTVLNQIEYLIRQSRHTMVETSYQSYASSVQSKLFMERISNLEISDETFEEITSKISTLKRIERYPLQMTIMGREQGEHSSRSQIYITTRCWGIKRIYFIFDRFHELIQLQALLDMEWRLDTIATIRNKFQEENIHLLRNSYNGYDLYFFQRTGPESWEKFISIINKSDDSYLMLTKASLFKEIYGKRRLFKVRIKIVFSDDISVQDYKVVQLKVFHPHVQFTNVHDLALSILRNNQQGYTLEGDILDCITSFNCIWMQQKGSKEMLMVRPDQNSTKEYVYFTFYSKLMEIVKQEGEENQLILVQRSLKEQFPSSIYRNSLEDVLKQAAVNQCPFFYFCQLPREVTKVDISTCKKVANNDVNRLIYYRYLLQEKHYKASAPNIKDIDQIAQRLESPFLFKFQCQQIVHKMGKTKSAEIVKKYREGAKGCILASASFCRSFIQKWLQVNPIK